MNVKSKALFLDRDGILNRMVYDENHGTMDSPRRVEQLTPMPGASVLLDHAKALGFLRVIVTNQPGIAKGTLTIPELDSLHTALSRLLSDAPCAWDACYVCPHHPAGAATDERKQYAIPCDCRKPAPGLLLRAAHDLNIDLAQSWMIGDGIVDIQAGHAAGCRTMLVTPLKPEILTRLLHLNIEPDIYAPDLETVLQHLKGDRK